MLVDVVRMRRGGRKWPDDEAKSTPPMRGELTIRTARGPGWSTTAATLTLDGHELLPHLADARTTELVGDSQMVAGTEIVRPIGPGVTDQFRQTWWCCVVHPSP